MHTLLVIVFVLAYYNPSSYFKLEEALCIRC